MQPAGRPSMQMQEQELSSNCGRGMGRQRKQKQAGRENGWMMRCSMVHTRRWAIMLKSPSPICPQMTTGWSTIPCSMPPRPHSAQGRDAMQDAVQVPPQSSSWLLPAKRPHLCYCRRRLISSSITAWNQCDRSQQHCTCMVQ